MSEHLSERGRPEINWERIADSLGFRIDAIARAHHKAVDGQGGTWGECLECGEEWPCPTYIWAMDSTIEPMCAWDAEHCEFDGHDHRNAILYPPGEPS